MNINAYCTAIFLTCISLALLGCFLCWIADGIKNLFSRKSRIKNLENKIESQEEEIADLEDKIESQTAEIDFIKSEKERITKDRDKLSGEISELRKRNVHLESLSHIDERSQAQQEQYKKDYEVIKQKNNEIESLMAKNRSLEAQLFTLSHDPENIAEELSTLKSENKRLHLDISALKNIHKGELNRLFSKYTKFEVIESCQTRYKVNYSEKGKTTYPLPADVRMVTVMYFSRVGEKIAFEKKEAPLYFLDCVYWSSGGYSSFLDNPPRLYMGKPIKALNHRNDECIITLTDERVPETQGEINKLNAKKRFIENKEKEAKKTISKLCSDAAATLPEFLNLLTEYEHSLDKQFAEFLKEKKFHAIKASEKIKSLSTKYRRLDKEHKTLQLEYDRLRIKFIELNSKSKDSDTDETN